MSSGIGSDDNIRSGTGHNATPAHPAQQHHLQPPASSGHGTANEDGGPAKVYGTNERTVSGIAPPRRMTIGQIRRKYQQRVPLTMVTAYDYPSAVHVDMAGIDMVLIGDSVGMVELGYETTLPVTVDEMLHHCKAVARATKRPLRIGDMPFGSYEVSAEEAVRNAIRFLKEGHVDAVKMEGGKGRAATVRRVVDAGVAVMGHIGLTPQSVSALGGFIAQGRTAAAAESLLHDAWALQDAGCFAVVIECVPEQVAEVVTNALEIPTIGIGAGVKTSGQVLVYHDLLGMVSHPHHEHFAPRFCKQYAQVGRAIQTALAAYRDDVTERRFPSPQHAPYTIDGEQWRRFEARAPSLIQARKEQQQQQEQHHPQQKKP